MSLLFDASTEQVEHGGPQLADPCSVLAWVKPSNVDANLRHLCSQVGAGGTVWRLMTSDGSGTGGRLRLFIPDVAANNMNYITDNGTLAANVWQCVGMVIDGSAGAGQRGSVYVGTLTTPMVEATYASFNDFGTALVATSGNLRFGRDTNGSFPFEGDIASIMVWPGTALTLVQLQLMQWLFRPEVAGCELYSLYGYGGANARDWSGQGSDGSITGATESDQAPLPSPFFGADKLWTPFSAAVAAGLGIPIAAYHYNHHLGSMT